MMGIYMKLTRAGINPIDVALARLFYCTEAIKYFKRDRFFVPQSVSIWLNAPSEALDGQRIYKEELTDDLESITRKLQTRIKNSFYAHNLPNSIILFEGVWQLHNLEMAGFFSSNNYRSWNRLYFDVEIDAYSKGEYGDLIDIFLAHGEVPTLVKNFVTCSRMSSQNQAIMPRFIYFSRGVPEYGEVDDLVALHLEDRNDMVKFLYAKLRRIEESWVKNQVEPIDRNFYVSSLVSIEIIQRLFSDVVKKTNLMENEGNSVTYIAEDTETFVKFFEHFKNEIFKPASKELPNADSLKEKMRNGLQGTKQTTLD
jgi:hypothetical protein